MKNGVKNVQAAAYNGVHRVVQFSMANIEGSLVEFGKVAQLLCLGGPIEAVTSSDYANRPPLNYHRCAGTKSNCNIHRNGSGEK